KQQSTRPQTLGCGLTDSPAGQAAWILEKFWAWTDCDDHPENVLSRDELLDNVMLYWVTETATSSARVYWESFGPKRRVAHRHRANRRRGVPEGDRAAGPALDGERLHRHPALDRDAERRSFRRLRTTGAVHRRRAQVLPHAAVKLASLSG